MVTFLTPLALNFKRRGDIAATLLTKGSLRHAFTANTFTGNISQSDIWPSPPRQVSDPPESLIVHLRYLLTNVPPQPNSPHESVPT